MNTIILRFLLAITSAAVAESSVESVPGQKEFKVSYDKATDFSGLTWVGGDTFYAVSNRTEALFPLNIVIDRESGKIESATFGKPVPVAAKLEDLEGIAYCREEDRFYVSAERPPGIVAFSRTGDATFRFEIPTVFGRANRNKGLEALTFGNGHVWTANEDVLEGDADSLIRLQKLTTRIKPLAQFAYPTDGTLFRVGGSGTGVTDLLALPNGDLLVLERVVAVGLVAKIFQIDFAGATDTTNVSKLDVDEVMPVKKKLLFERFTGRVNFEGIALGPELKDGWRSLILIADSGGSADHVLMPLRIKFRVTEQKAE